MTAEQTRLEQALADALDIVVLTDDRAKELVAPIFKQILALRDKNVPEDTITALLDALKACCEYNAALSVKAQTVCNTLDELSRGVSSVLTIKGIVKTLRPALKVLVDPQAHGAAEYVQATRTVDEIVAAVPRDRLLSESVRHELRSRAFRTLAAHLPRPGVVGGGGATIAAVPHLEVAR
jgi:hypothetical protein